MVAYGIIFMAAGALLAAIGLLSSPAIDTLGAGTLSPRQVVNLHLLFFQAGLVTAGAALFTSGAVLTAVGVLRQDLAPAAQAAPRNELEAQEARARDIDDARHFRG